MIPIESVVISVMVPPLIHWYSREPPSPAYIWKQEFWLTAARASESESSADGDMMKLSCVIWLKVTNIVQAAKSAKMTNMAIKKFLDAK